MTHLIKKSKKAFSFVEVMLSLALFSFIITLSVPIYQSFEFRNEVASSANVIVAAARTAQSKAIGNENDTPWGIYIGTGEVIIYSGTDYASREVSRDISLQLPGAPVVSGQNEFVFDQNSGEVAVPGNVQIEITSISREIEINEKGAIFY